MELGHGVISSARLQFGMPNKSELLRLPQAVNGSIREKIKHKFTKHALIAMKRELSALIVKLVLDLMRLKRFLITHRVACSSGHSAYAWAFASKR